MTRILLLAFVSVWFGAIVPGHQRGSVRLPSPTESCAERACHSCCPTEKDSQNTPADSRSAKNCAICLFACMLDVPMVEIVPLPQERVEPRDFLAVARLILQPPHFGDRAERGPPLV